MRTHLPSGRRRGKRNHGPSVSSGTGGHLARRREQRRPAGGCVSRSARSRDPHRRRATPGAREGACAERPVRAERRRSPRPRPHARAGRLCRSRGPIRTWRYTIRLRRIRQLFLCSRFATMHRSDTTYSRTRTPPGPAPSTRSPRGRAAMRVSRASIGSLCLRLSSPTANLTRRCRAVPVAGERPRLTRASAAPYASTHR